MHHPKHDHHQHLALAVFASMAVTAIIVGALVFSYQEKKFDERTKAMQKQLSAAGDVVKDLQTEKEKANKEAKNASDALKEVSKEVSNDENALCERLDLPLVRYGREGLLSATEKAALEKYLVEPYSLYYSVDETGGGIVTMYIEVPEKVGEPYLLTAIHEVGTAGMVFGERGGEMNYWQPTCMGECPYPDVFKEKYPQLVEEDN